MTEQAKAMHDPQSSNPPAGGADDQHACYQVWRARLISQCDEQYAQFCQEQPQAANADQQAFDRDFENWRRRRADRDARSTRTEAANPTTTTGASGL